MKKNIKNISGISLLLLSCFFNFACGAAESDSYKSEENSNLRIIPPYFIQMPSPNYNNRPENTKIDTIIIHHTAPFASLTRVGYFFQNINSRVSSHYIVGKEGLVIQSVDEHDRAWHAGPSAWRGKYNVNDFSIGIEVLNDGDNKDPFTDLQYISLSRLVSYIMKKYDIPLSRVIGHRDIAIPLGRKNDPADNFDWKLFKSKLRIQTGLSQNMMGFGEMPQDSNVKSNDVINNLSKDSSVEDRAIAVDSLLTLPYKNFESSIQSAFKQEYSETVEAKFFRLFEFYQDKNYIDAAKQITQRYKNISIPLLNQVVSYLSEVDPDNSKAIFINIFNDDTVTPERKVPFIKAISNYKDPAIKKLLIDELNKSKSLDEKKSIIESLAKFEDKSLNSVLIKYLSSENPATLKLATVDSLRITFDDQVESKFIDLLKNESNQDLLESISSAILRKSSKEGIKNLQLQNIYNKLNFRTKIGLFDTLGELKVIDSEDWIISKIGKDEIINSSIFLALGRITGEKSFKILGANLGKSVTSDLVILRALSNYNRPEVARAIKHILEKEDSSKVFKMLAISLIKENKMNNLLESIKVLSVENKDPEIEAMIEATVKSLENS